ncbi:MAG: 3-deoxy-D-manno-octulosonic acid transferase, partial [Gammaproteobacteria bacterium]
MPSLLLVLVPRHPERFDAVAGEVSRAGFACARRSRGEQVGGGTAVYLGDTMGELQMLYACADVAFVGGSFSGTGGHNMLEPAALGLPVATGPSLFNFQQVADALAGTGALQVVTDAEGLAGALGRWLLDDAARRSAGGRARAFVEANRGALARTLAQVEALVPG